VSILFERLYRSQQKELAAGLLAQERYLELKTVAAAATGPAVNFSAVPTGYTRVINGVSMVLIPGAAQIAQSATFSILVNGTVVAACGANSPYVLAAALQLVLFVNLGEGFICRPGDVLQVQGNFSAGAASNTVNATLNGYQFPTGNLR
jgi:stage V sporulation protein SpoVS